jgi:hypothetical protein
MIRNAIANKELIKFTYRGWVRIAEPHVYGVKNGKKQILVYQIGGSTSSGKIPDWRRINLDDMSGLRVLKGQEFPGPRTKEQSSDQDDWDTVIAAVK